MKRYLLLIPITLMPYALLFSLYCVFIDHYIWVVERKIPGIGYGVHHREPVEEVMIGSNRWVSKKEWKRAIAARKNGIATKEQKEMLDNGYWKA